MVADESFVDVSYGIIIAIIMSATYANDIEIFLPTFIYSAYLFFIHFDESLKCIILN